MQFRENVILWISHKKKQLFWNF